jgi:Cu/Ag efflux protein CusF
MVKFLLIFLGLATFALLAPAQDTTAAAKPTEHVLGTVTKVDAATHTVTVKDDKSGVEYAVLLENTKTLLKVPPGAKDLKTATRITADDLQAGDRVDVRGMKAAEPPNTIAARSVVLMSARELAATHQAEAAAWQHSTAGTVDDVDAADQKMNITVRTAEGPKAMIVDASKTKDFTRYSAENPKAPAASQLSEIQPGDQVRIIGEKSADGTTITAERVYSGAFRTIAGTVTTIGEDGKQIVVKDLQSKQPVTVTLTGDSVIRKLPPMMALALARRFNPDYKAAQGAGAGPGGNTGGARTDGGNATQGASAGPGGPGGPGGGPGGAGGGMRAGTGDLSRVLERAPTIGVSDLKPGDAIVISGVAQGQDKTRLLAASIIAGVEPIFQSAPPQQGRSLGDWSLDMQAPAAAQQ